MGFVDGKSMKFCSKKPRNLIIENTSTMIVRDALIIYIG